jgi:two-component system sensor kinase FixL
MDTTLRKRTLMESKQQLDEMIHFSRVRLLGELSGTLAHELNQPLTAILANAQAAKRFLTQDTVDICEVNTILDDIISDDRRAVEIIQRLRILLKKGDVRHDRLDLNDTIADVLKLIKSDLIHHDIALEVETDQNLPAISGDRVQLQQVLLNLIMNACDAMSQSEAGRRQLTIRIGQVKGRDKVEVSIFDQGTGISPGIMQKIFEPFYTTKSHGMGLGLAICRTIIQAHRGELWVTDNHPNGAVLHFTLPIFRRKIG